MIPIQTEALQHVPRRVVEHYLKPGILNLAALPPLSLYVHFPWCVRKCPYCDFNSHEAKGDIPEREYLEALRADLEQSLPLIWGRKIISVFIGGGTPSLLSEQGLDQLLSAIRSLLPLDAAAEITMEANPGTVEITRFKSYVASGVNRFSLGVQSFNHYHLQALGRIHDSDEARRAIDAAMSCTGNVNLDLMYALPSQTIEQAINDLDTALGLHPTHLSLYHLTLEPNTLFAKYPPALPDDDTSATMQQQLQQRLYEAGFQHYEVSAYAKPGRQSRHNRNYWEFGDYLGVGAGAHSKLSFPHRIIRQARFKHPSSYMQHASAGSVIQEEHEVDRDSLGFEFMLNALRLTEGVPTRLFFERTGMSTQSIEPALQRAEAKGLIEVDHQSIKPTDLGQRFLNDLQQIFLPE